MKIFLVVLFIIILFVTGGKFTLINPAPDTARYFNSVTEAELWIAENHLPIVLIAGDDGAISFNNMKYNPLFDCDDYAEAYETLALNSRFRIWQVPVLNGRIWGKYVTSIQGLHVGNMTKINNTYYYIETSPSPTRWNLIKIMDAD